MADVFVSNSPDGPGYPFTRLGYTYDSHPDAPQWKHYGASEFVVKPNTVAQVRQQTTTDDYCKAPR